MDKLSKNNRELQVQKLVSEEAITSFNISQLPLIRVTLYKLEELEHVLAITLHHIVADGWSIGLIFDELDTLYRGLTTSSDSHLPELPIQYADYAIWHQKKILEGSYQDQLIYWQNQLKGTLPVLELPYDKPRPSIQSFFTGSNQFILIPRKLSQELQSIGQKEGCTFFMTVLAAFQVLLHRYSGAEELIVGTPIANRSISEIEQLIGNFINMIALRTDLSGNPTFIELLHRVNEVTLNAFSNQDLPFEKFIENLHFKRDQSRNPIFQVMLQVSPRITTQLGGLAISSFQFNTQFAQLDLSVHLYEHEDGYRGRFEYDTDLFNVDTIERMSLHFQQLLTGIVSNPHQKISKLPILDEKNKKNILLEWNNTSVDYPKGKCLHHLFEQQAEKTGARNAVECDGKTLTYDELNSRANQLANYLIKSGAKPATHIGICVERSIEMVVGLLGILKTGAAYVPMDPSFPAERLGYMLGDANILILITQKHLLNIFPQSDRKAICIDKELKNIQNESVGNPSITIDSAHLAYIIYTSGSTGIPKGVMIEHSSMVNFLISMQNKPGLDENDVLVAVTTISFDIAALEIFLPLISGAEIVLASRNEAIDGNSLLKLIERSNATMMQATPATWKLMLKAGWEQTPNLKMLCGGETLPRGLANKILKIGRELWNMYGPTETTIWSSVKKVNEGKGSVPIGPPIANTQFYVVDKEMQPVPIGVPGELLIGGDGLARGYWNRPELTEDRFVENQFTNDISRMYKTGDLVKLHSTGDIEFLGRLDFQVKIRGFRIELGGIENTLAQHK
ncbi:MAG TPA: amino acid adenylation domain-containing protein, partial [bacterium]|nr:amino acid adenylation domain-containing protein [bacterium]